MVAGIGWPVRQHEHRTIPLPTVDPVVAVELVDRHVVPATTTEDRTRALQDLIGEVAPLHIDVAGALATIAPFGNNPVHRVVRPCDEAIERHRYVPDHL